jgi:hypothetical protein
MSVPAGKRKAAAVLPAESLTIRENPLASTVAFDLLKISTNSSFAPFGPRVRSSLITSVVDAAGAAVARNSGARTRALPSRRRMTTPLPR